jgi:homoserine kinase
MSDGIPSIQIRVPATSANLGAGFDCLAVAFNLWNQANIEFSGKGYRVRVHGEGEGLLPEDDNNLIVKAFLFTLKKLGIDAPEGVLFSCENHIPMGSGLGSSATAVLIGVIAATTLNPDFENKDTWLQLSAELEGHADNVSAAIFGGLVAVRKCCETFKALLFDVEPENAVLLLPAVDLSTQAARKALPLTVSMADAVANISRIPAILEGFRQGDVDLLRDGLTDCLHQPYRLPLIPGAAEAITAANKSGAAAALSGAGPSVIAFMPADCDATAEAMGQCFDTSGLAYRAFQLEMINRGAQVNRL